MSDGPILIKRYPNRRYYARNTSRYVSLNDIETMVQAGETIEIRDSQTGDNLTGAVLAQIIMERHPDKLSLFPTDMLHFILQSNDTMSSFLREYFRHSLTYLNHLRQHGAAATTLPFQWAKSLFQGVDAHERHTAADPASASTETSEPLAERVQQLEERLRQLESEDR
jgi:polyhydroxyalkanoate synthesis repressor PhaR